MGGEYRLDMAVSGQMTGHARRGWRGTQALAVELP